MCSSDLKNPRLSARRPMSIGNAIVRRFASVNCPFQHRLPKQNCASMTKRSSRTPFELRTCRVSMTLASSLRGFSPAFCRNQNSTQSASPRANGLIRVAWIDEVAAPLSILAWTCSSPSVGIVTSSHQPISTSAFLRAWALDAAAIGTPSDN